MKKPVIHFNDFLKIDIRSGTIIEVLDFPEAKKPAYQLKIDFGELGVLRSSAQICDFYSKESLLNKQVLAVVNFPEKQIANFFSQCLVLGLEKNGGIVLASADQRVENGAALM